MKRRLCEAALPEMKLSFAGEKTVSEKALCPLESAAFVEVLPVRYEDVADEIRVAEEVDGLRSDFPPRDVAVLSLHRHHHRERIAGNLHHELTRVAYA